MRSARPGPRGGARTIGTRIAAGTRPRPRIASTQRTRERPDPRPHLGSDAHLETLRGLKVRDHFLYQEPADPYRLRPVRHVLCEVESVASAVIVARPVDGTRPRASR
jgi:hypothetical protein